MGRLVLTKSQIQSFLCCALMSALLLTSPHAQANTHVIETHTITLDKPETFVGIEFPAGSKITFRDPDNTFFDGVLTQDLNIEGIKVLSGSEISGNMYGKGWTIENTIPNQTINGMSIPSSSTVIIFNGAIWSIDFKFSIGRIRNFDVIFQSYLYKDGSPWLIVPSHDVQIDSIPWQGNKSPVDQCPIIFYKSGKVMSGTLGANEHFTAHKDGLPDETVDLAKGDRITLDEQGRVIGIYFKNLRYQQSPIYNDFKYPDYNIGE